MVLQSDSLAIKWLQPNNLRWPASPGHLQPLAGWGCAPPRRAAWLRCQPSSLQPSFFQPTDTTDTAPPIPLETMARPGSAHQLWLGRTCNSSLTGFSCLSTWVRILTGRPEPFSLTTQPLQTWLQQTLLLPGTQSFPLTDPLLPDPFPFPHFSVNSSGVGSASLKASYLSQSQPRRAWAGPRGTQEPQKVKSLPLMGEELEPPLRCRRGPQASPWCSATSTQTHCSLRGCTGPGWWWQAGKTSHRIKIFEPRKIKLNLLFSFCYRIWLLKISFLQYI